MALTASVLKEIAFTYIFLDTCGRGFYQNSKKMWKMGQK